MKYLKYCLFLFVLSWGCSDCGDKGTAIENSETPNVEVDAGMPECVDDDGDGFGVGLTCDGRVDCNDDDPASNPDAEEACGDELDNNCDGTIDEGCPDCDEGATRECGNDEGRCVLGTQTCRNNEWSDCEGTEGPFPEVCNGEDDDCDGTVDENPGLLCDDNKQCNGVEVCEAGACVPGEETDCSDLDGPCVVGVCSEKDGGCVAMPLENGTTCDDGNFCTVEGTCNSGVCESTARDCAGAGDACNTGVCDEDADACVPQPVADGTTCDDSEFCTVMDTCSAGVCGGQARDCSGEADQCNAGICDETADACVKDPVVDGTTCEDGEYCTVNDSCQAGTCAGGGPRECGAAGGSCRTGVCDETLDACTGDPVADGTPCEDGMFCTTGDSCLAGACEAGGQRDCSSADGLCKVGACNEMLNFCFPQDAPNGSTCDDGSFCTVTDTCTSGMCNGVARDCTTYDDPCNTGVCDDILDSCKAAPKSDGTSCVDSAFCTVNEMCMSGVCNTDPRDCSTYDDDCNDGICDETAGSCAPEPKVNGTSCSDGDLCTENDVCTAGSCAGSDKSCANLDDQCNVGMCDLTTGNCVAVPVTDGTSCDDGSWCTETDVCNAGVCAGLARDCSSYDDQCNDGMCDDANDTCYAEPKMNGTACDDDLFCTDGDVCTDGVCDGPATDCSTFDDQCNVGSCDENGDTCFADPVSDGTICSDGDLCTENDVCSAGSCGGAAKDCSFLDDGCNVGMCDAVTGNCVAVPVSDGTACDDGLFCTEADVCTAGVCGGATRDCSTYDGECTIGACDESGGTCYAQPKLDGTVCDDGLYCTDGDVCTAGVCDGSQRDCSDEDDQCNTGVCDEAANSCVKDPKTDGISCDDTLFCTENDVCTAGSCGGSAIDCSDESDQCNEGVCDEASDSCVPEPIDDGTSCDDGLFCTVSDQCSSGVCDGSAKSCVFSSDQCNIGVCDDDVDACVKDPRPDGTTCDDGSWCTVGDSCAAGTCVASDRDCSGVEDQCNSSACDEANEECVAVPLPNTTPCDDTMFCTESDTCDNGFCDGTPIDCSAADDECNLGVCNDVSDACEPMPIADGSTCTDGLFCTVSDSCNAGVCVGDARSCVFASDQCNFGVCDDAADACVKDPRPDGTDCEDGEFCTENDFCSGGSCAAGSDVVCPGDQCNQGVCDETNDICDTTPKADGTSCDDGQYCTANDECVGGGCFGGGTLDCRGVLGLSDPCELASCDESANMCEMYYDTMNPLCCDSSIDADFDGSNQCLDCDDTNGAAYPGATEFCNGIDDDCDGDIDEDFDADGDGFGVCANDPTIFDCDDSDPLVNPGMTEICDDGMSGNTGNGIDDDCDGYIDEGCNPCSTDDIDGDLRSECDGDCDDNDPLTYPGAPELCDGKDNDCNIFTTPNCGVSDECNHDGDGNFANDPDQCRDDMLCANVYSGRGANSNLGYRCTSFCNSSDTGPLGDGCEPNQTCVLDLLYSANVHGCAVNTDPPGGLRGGAVCARDDECRSLACENFGPAGKLCWDFCSSDSDCATGASCRLRHNAGGMTVANADGRCWPDAETTGSSIGASCSFDTNCDKRACVTDPNDATQYCTDLCCTDSDCPSGYTCSLGGIGERSVSRTSGQPLVATPPDDAPPCSVDGDCVGDGGICFSGECTFPIFDTTGQCVQDVASQGTRRGGQACASNSECASNFCEKDLGVCIEMCCADSTCPTGLECELTTVERKFDEATVARVCLSFSTDDILERK